MAFIYSGSGRSFNVDNESPQFESASSVFVRVYWMLLYLLYHYNHGSFLTHVQPISRADGAKYIIKSLFVYFFKSYLPAVVMIKHSYQYVTLK